MLMSLDDGFRQVSVCQTCKRTVIVVLESDRQDPPMWRMYDCPHCRKANFRLLPSPVLAAFAVKDTTLTLEPSCRHCGGEVRLQFTDWDNPPPAALAPDWDCPHCQRVNTLPSLGRIASVQPVRSTPAVRANPPVRI